LVKPSPVTGRLTSSNEALTASAKLELELELELEA